CSSFLFLDRPPPSPTLFPYTTLFRSSDPLVVCLQFVPFGSFRRLMPFSVFRRGCFHEISPFHRRARTAAQGHRWAAGPVMQSGADRKSTRLNSSHVKSSYAVFCLRKK